MTIRVNALPMVNAGVDTSLCDQPISVTFTGQPIGGVWLGSGVTSGGVFTPNGVSVYTLRYGYTAANTGCYNEDSLDVDVVAPDNANAGLDRSVCIDTGQIQFAGTPNTGTTGFWSGNGIDSVGLYNVISSGNYNFTYSYGEGNC